MRITFVLPHLALSGGDKITLIYANGLAANGHDVTVVHGILPTLKARMKHAFFGSSPAFHIERRNVRFVGVSGRPSNLLHKLPDADVLVASWWETVEAVSKASPSKGRLVHHVQGHEVFPYLPARSASVYKLPCPKIVISTWLWDLMRTTYRSADVTLVPNPVDVRQFDWFKRTQFPRQTVGTVYSTTPVKNSEMAVEAVKQAREKFSALKLICFGSESPPPAVFKIPWVEFHLRPPQSEIPELYRACDFWLFSSVAEGFGLPILEAMAVGTPVIATRAGAAPELIRPGTGELVDHDARKMARTLTSLLDETPAQYFARSAACREIAETHDIPSAVSRFEKALFDAVGSQ